VLTYVQEQQERDEQDFRLVQAGIRHRLSAVGPVLGFAVGAGLGRDSPAFQVAFAVQWSFGLAEAITCLRGRQGSTRSSAPTSDHRSTSPRLAPSENARDEVWVVH
jgi:hypothetical protein